MGHVIWIDATAGVAGDMLAAALLDAGVPLGAMADAVERMLPGRVRLRIEATQRCGLRAQKFDIEIIETEAPHRHLADIMALLEGSGLAASAQERIRAVFTRLAEAEAAVHGVTSDAVHFHEVGAVDSIADIVSVCVGLDWLGIDEVLFSDIALGSGAVRTAHGLLPVPTPAALQLTRGLVVSARGSGELATPTGIALISTLGQQQQLPELVVRASGVGAGSKDFEDHPNVVRVIVGDRVESASSSMLIESNVDDMDPRLWPAAIDALLAAGAQDAWLTPIIMKKGRPAHTVSVLCDRDAVQRLTDILFQQTSTIGARVVEVSKLALDRRFDAVEVDGHRIAVKLAARHGRVVNVSLEFEDVALAAHALGLPQRQVLEAARAAADAAGLVSGAPF